MELRTLLFSLPRAGPGSARRTRLFLCGCCRLVWPLLVDERSRQAVEVGERLADGRAGEDEAREAYARSLRVLAHFRHKTGRGSAAMAAAASLTPEESLDGMAIRAAESTRMAARGARRLALHRAQCDLFRDIFGDPKRPEPFDPAWLTPTAVELARDIYDHRDFGKMPFLGDAIEEAGCANPPVLEHCRRELDHARGCWVLDALTGRGAV